MSLNNENTSPMAAVPATSANSRNKQISDLGKLVVENLAAFFSDTGCTRDSMFDLVQDYNYCDHAVVKALYDEVIDGLIKNGEIFQHHNEVLTHGPSPPNPELNSLLNYSRPVVVKDLCRCIMKKINGTTTHHYTRTLLNQLKRENKNLQKETDEVTQREIFNEALRTLTHNNKIIRLRNTIYLRRPGMPGTRRRFWVKVTPN